MSTFTFFMLTDGSRERTVMVRGKENADCVAHLSRFMNERGLKLHSLYQVDMQNANLALNWFSAAIG